MSLVTLSQSLNAAAQLTHSGDKVGPGIITHASAMMFKQAQENGRDKSVVRDTAMTTSLMMAKCDSLHKYVSHNRLAVTLYGFCVDRYFFHSFSGVFLAFL